MSENNFNIQLFCNYVAILPSNAESFSRGGLSLPGGAQFPKMPRGTVVAVGPGRVRTDNGVEVKEVLPVKVGDIVYAINPGIPVQVAGVEYFILDSGMIIGVEMTEEVH